MDFSLKTASYHAKTVKTIIDIQKQNTALMRDIALTIQRKKEEINQTAENAEKIVAMEKSNKKFELASANIEIVL